MFLPERFQQGARLDLPGGDGTRPATWARGSETATSRRRYTFWRYFSAWWTATVASAAAMAFRMRLRSRAPGAGEIDDRRCPRRRLRGAEELQQGASGDLRGRKVARPVGSGNGLREGGDELLAQVARRSGFRSRCGSGSGCQRHVTHGRRGHRRKRHGIVQPTRERGVSARDRQVGTGLGLLKTR